jgi:hypothetical protein
VHPAPCISRKIAGIRPLGIFTVLDYITLAFPLGEPRLFTERARAVHSADTLTMTDTKVQLDFDGIKDAINSCDPKSLDRIVKESLGRPGMKPSMVSQPLAGILRSVRPLDRTQCSRQAMTFFMCSSTAWVAVIDEGARSPLTTRPAARSHQNGTFSKFIQKSSGPPFVIPGEEIFLMPLHLVKHLMSS